MTEMFFARAPIFVESLEDVAHITAGMHILGYWEESRRHGCHIIPANAKSRLIHPVASAADLEIPFFPVFDSDGGETVHPRRDKHSQDNRALMRLLGLAGPEFPEGHVYGSNYAMWKDDIGQAVRDDFADKTYKAATEPAMAKYGHERRMQKIGVFIAEWLAAAADAGETSPTLERLCDAILAFGADAG
jgi:putative ATP-dependent endonuclease of the OLD family